MIRRAPLDRYTPLLSKTPLRRKKPLSPVSAKRAKQNRAIRPAKEAFLRRFPWCWVPACGKRSLHVHHIAHRSHPEFECRENWMPLCPGCHDAHHNGKLHLTMEVQLALKFMYDPLFFDRVLVLRVRGLQPSAITEDEVMEAVRCLQ